MVLHCFLHNAEYCFPENYSFSYHFIRLTCKDLCYFCFIIIFFFFNAAAVPFSKFTLTDLIHLIIRLALFVIWKLDLEKICLHFPDLFEFSLINFEICCESMLLISIVSFKYIVYMIDAKVDTDVVLQVLPIWGAFTLPRYFIWKFLRH